MTSLRFHVLGRSTQFWRRLAHDLPDDPEVYLNPEEAERLLDVIPQHEDLPKLRTDVIRLYHLLPHGVSGGDAVALTNLKFGG